MSKKRDKSSPAITLEIPVSDRLKGWSGEDLIITDPQTDEPLSEERQMNVGRALVQLLSAFVPKQPEESILVLRVGMDIAKAEEEGEPYTANERALGVLRKAWRQNGAQGPQRNAMFLPLVQGQLGVLLGLGPKAEALEEEEEAPNGRESTG